MEVQADDRIPTLLDGDAFDLASRILETIPEPTVFASFGAYRIEGQIGKGGMAEVILAWEEPAGRRVALKFLRQSWVTPELRERFAREIQTLAKLEHPLIARLYELGVHPNGTPYFAMEYIEGEPLDKHCRDRNYSVEEKLRLFHSVCEAVQYAHVNLVVHRDLKPSNIFVKEDGTPRLLDFGIAKQLAKPGIAADQTKTELRFTRAFAAPEQLLGEQVGTYTDVYALGVILYELLTGKQPYDFGGCSPLEAEVVITGDREPDKPSAVASRNSLRTGNVAWDDLDLLCLTAMKKDVRERYSSAGDLAQEIDRFLKGEPLKAGPATRRYRMGKFVRRHHRPIAVAALVFTLIVGLTTFFTLRLSGARDEALAEAARTRNVEQFMLNLFDGGDKEAGPPESLRVVTLLDRGALEAQSLKHDPAIQAELYETLAGMYQKLGKFDRAEVLLNAALNENRSAFGPDGEKVANSLLGFGLLRLDQARLKDAERLIGEAEAMDRRHLPPGAPSAARAEGAMGRVLSESGQYNKAIKVLTEAVNFQSTPNAMKSDLAESLTGLGDAHFYLGHYTTSDTLYEKALALHRQLHGDTHPLVANDLVNLGNIQFQLGHYSEAEQYDRRALSINQAWYGRGHPETARDATYVSQALLSEKRYKEAAALLKGTLEALEQSYGKFHPRVALVLIDLGTVHQELGNLNDAAASFRRASEIYKAVYGDQHQLTAIALANLATIYLKQGQYARAEVLFRDSIQRFTVALSADHINTGIARVKLGRALVLQKRYGEAQRESAAGYEILMKQTSPSVDWIVEAKKDLVKEYEALGQSEKADVFRVTAGAPDGARIPR